MSDSLENTNLRERMERLQKLVEFSEHCQKQIQDMYDALGWSPDYDPDKEPMELCPYDPSHRVPVRSMEKHKASCYLRKTGYSSEEQVAHFPFLSSTRGLVWGKIKLAVLQAEMCDPSASYINTSVRSFTMDKNLQNQVILQARSAAPLMKMEGVFWQGQYSYHPVDVPQNHKRAVCDLTVADRLALYDHVIAVLNQEKANAATSGNDELYIDLVSQLKKAEQQNEPKTHLELMAEMRDYKRRRQSYRAKNVHITKKSYTEVIREVIQVHSEELARQWKEEHEEDANEEEAREGTSQRSRRSNERRSLSSESRRSRSRRHRSREKSRDKESKKNKRKRDSRSPEGRHRDSKKKKKRKVERGRSDS
ncbi:U11/U12 small nuclear ribonucleoprotein 48 kDa protein isoform X2 [Phyllopteryx taeniolatus]|uniref:U11/U12 small nuclear ribonucleoprotein 48 kDa protein isoform X2 n=1 Tax=Phyllopteryx taeniolatus TaxID=161469 RepID=UPI002AD4ECDF|nr:U11/U12 small nuclear ribonucleoprotein 48 kDa protein isoform X2 [Phyllopteryx taeniolatus]